MVKNKFKSIRTLQLILSFLILHLSVAGGFFTSHATVRYVSHEGSNTPPFLNWETAADSIMSAINISVFGDTIYVANGVYEEEVVMIPGLTLIGAGMDSCVIDTRELVYSGIRTVEIFDSCTIKGFKLFVGPLLGPRYGTAVFMSDTTFDCVIESNYMFSAAQGVWATDCTIKRNIISNVEWGISFGSSLNFIDTFKVFIDSNFISFSNDGIFSHNSIIPQEMYARGNVFYFENPYTTHSRIYTNGLSLTNTPEFNNNLTISAIDSILYHYGIVNTREGFFANNVFLTKFEYAYSTISPTTIRNNVIVGSINGVQGSEGLDVKYNDFWQVESPYIGFIIPDDTTNIRVDPMFVNEDSMDFHLQMFSPLIDAGDPNILDINGSRSDIGLWGGPYGGRYTYRDLAPKPPSNLTAVYDSGFVLLRWNRNTEADFYRYRVYRDTVPNFIYDTTKIIAVVADTFYYDDLPEKYLQTDYYYKLTAMDSTGHQSATSEEVHVTVTGVPEGPPIVLEEYKLLQNYPNPFNPSTIIPYRLIEPGYVKLYVYDIKGELVRALVNEYQTVGYYEVEFRPNSSERGQGELGLDWATGYNDDIASGIYIYQIMVKSDRNIPVFTDMNKMILLK